jgi:type IV pilus assembly protein PilN
MALRVPINLASEPFRRDRPLLVGSAALGIVLSLLLIYQVVYIVSERHQAADIRIAIDRQNARLKDIAGQQAKLNATLRRPENAEVLERSLFLNTLIERKAISWTKIFEDLEKVMPYNVRLVSVRLPEVDSHNQVLLDMVVGAKDVPPILELFKRLEGSPQFGNTSVQSSAPPSQTDPFYRYHVTVTYAQKL